MAVKIGSARSDERGKITGGSIGDQKSGKEVSTQNWYLHSKGWRVFRAKDNTKAKKIAEAMIAACANNNIGYDQYNRNHLYNLASKVNFDISKVTTKTETDCSALVRVCCAYAGIKLGNFNTSTEPNVLLSSGEFTELKGDKYTKKSNLLRAGDILCTSKKGHTVIVISNGSEIDSSNDSTLRKGDKGEAVKELQNLLIAAGYNIGTSGAKKNGVDGDFGEKTLEAVKAFQKANGLEVDGVVGEKTLNALKGLQAVKMVVVTGNTVNLREGAGTKYDDIGTVKKGEEMKYISTASNGWFKVNYNGKDCYISNKYSKIK